MNSLEKQCQKSIKEHELFTIQSRNENRLLWEKIITICLTILGFSFTMFSTDFLSQKIASPESIYKYWLLSSWVFYMISIIVGFVLLKKETGFQKQEVLRKILYNQDLYEILDEETLQIKKDKGPSWIALQILHGERLENNDIWSTEAKEICNERKKDLQSYKLQKNPEIFYSSSHIKSIIHYEDSFYFLTILATLLFMISVILLCLSS